MYIIKQHTEVLDKLRRENVWKNCKDESDALQFFIELGERAQNEGKILDILEENTEEQKSGMGIYCGCKVTYLGEATKQIVSYLEGK